MPLAVRGGGALGASGAVGGGLLYGQVEIRSPESDAPPLSLRSVFGQAIASNVLNPKIAVFFLAYLPQCDDPASGSVALQLLALGSAFALTARAVFNVIVHFSGALGRWLKGCPRFAGALGWLTGNVLVTLGLRLALPERR